MSTQDLLLFLFLRAYRVLSKAYYAKGVLSKYSFMQMRNKTLIMLALMLCSLSAGAQWRVGVNLGATCNHYSFDRQYMTDYNSKDRWGFTMGVSGQYNFTDWFGVRADLNWTQKNYRLTRDRITMNYRYTNHYILLPVMASFSFGSEKWRGFCNLGVYGGYWLSSNYDAIDCNAISGGVYHIRGHVEFNSERDKRWDCGFVGGLGVEYRFAPHWGAQIEARYYYSGTSVTKQYMRAKDYRYNNTLSLQTGVNYYF
jgi:opacity protein-like surface antigen